MNRVWIVAADSSRAQIYEADLKLETIKDLISLVHEESRMHETEITSDLPGRMSSSQPGTRHTFEDHTPVKEQEKNEFARQLAERLDEGRKKSRYSKLAIIAPPDFLGVLRHQLNTHVAKLVVHEANKNLTRGSQAELRKALPKTFFSNLE